MALARMTSVRKKALGVSLDFVHAFREKEAAEAEGRLREWSAESAFTDPETKKIAATPKHTDKTGWSVAVWLPSGRSTFISLTVERPDLKDVLCPHLPDYSGEPSSPSELDASQRKAIIESWLPTYAVSTRAVWDEAVDPHMFKGATSYDLKDPAKGKCFAEVMQSDGRGEFIGDPSIFVSHALDNSFASLDDALQRFAKRRELDPAQTFVLLDGFSVAQEEDEDAQSAHFASSFMKSIETCGSFVLVFEPWERPLPLWRAWCVWEMYCAYKTMDKGTKWEIIMGPQHEALFGKMLVNEGASQILDTIRDMDVANAVAYRPEEAEMIHGEIKKLASDEVSSGHTAVNTALKGILRYTVSECSTRLLQEATAAAAAAPEPEDAAGRLKQQFASTREKEVTADLLYERGEGTWAEAEKLYREVLEAREQLPSLKSAAEGGEEDEAAKQLAALTEQMAVSIRAKLGRLLYERGEYGEAEQLFREVMASRRGFEDAAKLGANPWMDNRGAVLRAEANLAIILKTKGALEEAEEILRTVLAYQLEALSESLADGDVASDTHRQQVAEGFEARDVVDTKSNLVSLLRDRGRGNYPLEEVESLQEAVVRWRLSVFGPSNPNTMDAEAALAVIRHEAGKEGQLEKLREVHVRQQEMLGSSNMDTIATQNSLANLYAEDGDHHSAKEQLEDLLPRLVKATGDKHPHTLSTRSSLAHCLASTGDYDGAVELLTDVAAAQEEVLPGGADHPDVARTGQTLEQLKGMQERAKDAMVVFRAIDTDSSGSISTDELSGALSDFGLADAAIEQLTMKLVMMLDTNKDGVIDQHEWVRGYPAWKQLEEQINAAHAQQ